MFFIIASIPFSTLLSLNNISFGQNSTDQSFFSSTGPDMSSNNNSNNLSLIDDYQNFSSDFTDFNDTSQWTRISGIWNYTSDGYQGGIKENVSTPINIIVSPVNSSGSRGVSTTFGIHEIANEKPSLFPYPSSYVSMIFAFKDPYNYKQTGISIQNETISLFANTITDDVTTDTFLAPLNKTLDGSSNTTFTMSLLLENNKQALFLDGTEYPISMNGASLDGNVGLAYGGMENITFYDFKTKSINQLAERASSNSTKLIDAQSILLEGKSLPENSYVPLYDSKPYQILSGHVAAKLPCDSDNSSDVQIVIGNITELNPIELELIPELSIADSMCLYHGNIQSNQNSVIHDILIQNNSTDDIDFPETSSITISIAGLSQSSDTR